MYPPPTNPLNLTVTPRRPDSYAIFFVEIRTPVNEA
jgi:hypothetical protein